MHCYVLWFTVKTEYIGSFGRQTNAPDGLSFPIGVNVTADGKLLVGDTRSNMVKLFNKDGSVAGTISCSVRRLVMQYCYILAVPLLSKGVFDWLNPHLNL